jgi:hypothetical protein
MADLTDFDPAPAMGMFSEGVDLSDFRLVLGLLHIEHEDAVRVAVYDGTCVRHLSPNAVKSWVSEIESVIVLKPVVTAVRALAQRAAEINAQVMCNRAAQSVGARALAAMPVEGRA